MVAQKQQEDFSSLSSKRPAVELPGLSSGLKERLASPKALPSTSGEPGPPLQHLLQSSQKAVGMFPLNFVGH